MRWETGMQRNPGLLRLVVMWRLLGDRGVASWAPSTWRHSRAGGGEGFVWWIRGKSARNGRGNGVRRDKEREIRGETRRERVRE